jgi:hypothetical protein
MGMSSPKPANPHGATGLINADINGASHNSTSVAEKSGSKFKTEVFACEGDFEFYCMNSLEGRPVPIYCGA